MSVWKSDETPRSSSKILRCASIFNSLLDVSSGDETLHLMFDIFLETHQAGVFLSE